MFILHDNHLLLLITICICCYWNVSLRKEINLGSNCLEYLKKKKHFIKSVLYQKIVKKKPVKFL